MSNTIPQSVSTDCRKYAKSKIVFDKLNTFINVMSICEKPLPSAKDSRDFLWSLEVCYPDDVCPSACDVGRTSRVACVEFRIISGVDVIPVTFVVEAYLVD